MRTAVAIYLVLVTSAGPWPCCCALPGSAHQSAESNSSSGLLSCCHAAKTRLGEPASRGVNRVAADKRSTGGQTPSSCPCGERRCAVKARPDLTRPVTSYSQSYEPSAAGGVFVAVVPTAAPALAGTPGSNRALGAAARLTGHRVLRC